MNAEQKALLVRTGPEATHGLDELNVLLGRGWRVAHVTPMGAAGVGAEAGTPALHFAALVVVERAGEAAAVLLGEAEEEIEEIIEDLVEGDGADVELGGDLGPEDLLRG